MLMWILFVGIIMVDGGLVSYPITGCVLAFIGTFAVPIKNMAWKLRVELVSGAILCLAFGRIAVMRYVWIALSLCILRSVAACVQKYEVALQKDCGGVVLMSIWGMYAVLSVIVYALRFFDHCVLAIFPAVLGLIAEIGYIYFLYAAISKITPFPGLSSFKKRSSV